MDLPFLLSQSRISRAYDLTPDLKTRYGANIRFISAKLRYLCFSQYTSSWLIVGFWGRNLELGSFFNLKIENFIRQFKGDET